MDIKKCLLCIFIFFSTNQSSGQHVETLVYHPIVTDHEGHILPWYDSNLGKSYDYILHLVWNFWSAMRTDPNGLPYYMNHQVWNPNFNDPRGIGGDQLAMATVPELAPDDENHILSSTSIIQQADYKGYLKKFLFLEYSDVDTNALLIYYRTYDPQGTEILRLTTKPSKILINNGPLPESKQGEGFEWKNLTKGGVLTVHRKHGSKIIILR
jgi:hypothetical protein